MILLTDRITVVDFLDAGACFGGVKAFVAKTGLIAGPVIDLSGDAKEFFYGYGGDGDGYGYGDGGGGYGGGYGDGYGDGYGYGYGGGGDGYGDG